VVVIRKTVPVRHTWQAFGRGARGRALFWVGVEAVPQTDGVTVVVPSFNSAPFLADAIASIIATRYTPIEVIIVDDGSTDGAFELAARLSEQNPSIVRVITHDGHRNQGDGASRNLGIRNAQFEIVAFLDADDLFFPNRFDAAPALLAKRRDIDAVCEGTIVRIEAGGEKRIGTVRDRLVFDCTDPNEVLQRRLSGRLAWATSAITVRRAALERTGGFSTTRGLPADAVAWLKLAAGAKIVGGQREPVSLYRIHRANISHSDIAPSDTNYRVINEALDWARRNNVERAQLEILRDGARGKLYFLASEQRKRGMLAECLKMLATAPKSDPWLLSTARYWRNVAAVAIERFHRRAA
jgi:Glycosyl transferase family 2